MMALKAPLFFYGSGIVESGIRQFKQPLTGPGMLWSRPGADRMLVIRAAVMTDAFEKVWAAAPKLTTSGDCTRISCVLG